MVRLHWLPEKCCRLLEIAKNTIQSCCTKTLDCTAATFIFQQTTLSKKKKKEEKKNTHISLSNLLMHNGAYDTTFLKRLSPWPASSTLWKLLIFKRYASSPLKLNYLFLSFCTSLELCKKELAAPKELNPLLCLPSFPSQATLVHEPYIVSLFIFLLAILEHQSAS